MWTSASPLCSAEKAGKKFIQKLNSTQERLSVFFLYLYLQPLQSNFTVYNFLSQIHHAEI